MRIQHAFRLGESLVLAHLASVVVEELSLNLPALRLREFFGWELNRGKLHGCQFCGVVQRGTSYLQVSTTTGSEHFTGLASRVPATNAFIW